MSSQTFSVYFFFLQIAWTIVGEIRSIFAWHREEFFPYMAPALLRSWCLYAFRCPQPSRQSLVDHYGVLRHSSFFLRLSSLP